MVRLNVIRILDKPRRNTGAMHPFEAPDRVLYYVVVYIIDVAMD